MNKNNLPARYRDNWKKCECGNRAVFRSKYTKDFFLCKSCTEDPIYSRGFKEGDYALIDPKFASLL